MLNKNHPFKSLFDKYIEQDPVASILRNSHMNKIKERGLKININSVIKTLEAFLEENCRWEFRDYSAIQILNRMTEATKTRRYYYETSKTIVVDFINFCGNLWGIEYALCIEDI